MPIVPITGTGKYMSQVKAKDSAEPDKPGKAGGKAEERRGTPHTGPHMRSEGRTSGEPQFQTVAGILREVKLLTLLGTCNAVMRMV